MKDIFNKIKLLEESLLHTDMRSHPETLNALLAIEFEEVSPTGQIVSRESVLEWLLNKDVNVRWALEDFQFRDLGNELVLLRYQAKQIAPQVSTSLGSLRTSLWRKNIDTECWQMVFHQATKIS